MNHFVASKEACKHLDCHPATLRRLARLGRIPSVKAASGYHYRYDVSAYLESLENAADTPQKEACK